MIGFSARHDCCGSSVDHLWYDKGQWIFDTGDGMRGPAVSHCPWCGIKLPALIIIKEPDMTETLPTARVVENGLAEL